MFGNWKRGVEGWFWGMLERLVLLSILLAIERVVGWSSESLPKSPGFISISWFLCSFGEVVKRVQGWGFVSVNSWGRENYVKRFFFCGNWYWEFLLWYCWQDGEFCYEEVRISVFDSWGWGIVLKANGMVVLRGWFSVLFNASGYELWGNCAVLFFRILGGGFCYEVLFSWLLIDPKLIELVNMIVRKNWKFCYQLVAMNPLNSIAWLNFKSVMNVKPWN